MPKSETIQISSGGLCPSNMFVPNDNKNTRFPNVAGMENPDDILTRELELAGIEVCRLPEFTRDSRGEVKSIILGDCNMWSFTRAWYYWICKGPGIPPSYAIALHEEYGKVVRVAGHCMSPSPTEWYKGFAVGDYHVDTQEGLKALADTIKKVRAESGIPLEEDSKEK